MVRHFNFDVLRFVKEIIIKQEDIDRHLHFLKECLQWRFYTEDRSWLCFNLNLDCDIVCVVDQTIRDIFYPKGFIVDGCFRGILQHFMDNGCALRFREACKKFLSSNESVSDSNQLVIALREASSKRRRLILKNNEEH